MSSDIFLATDRPFSAVIFERGQASNIAFCRALIKDTIPIFSFAPRSIIETNLSDIVWLDVRDRKSTGSTRQYFGCDDLLDQFDYTRSRALAKDFSLLGSQGPWVISIDEHRRVAVLLDFSGYNEDDYGPALEKWKKYLAENHGFWTETSSTDLASLYLITYFMPEATHGLIKVRIWR